MNKLPKSAPSSSTFRLAEKGGPSKSLKRAKGGNGKAWWEAGKWQVGSGKLRGGQRWNRAMMRFQFESERRALISVQDPSVG